MFTTIKSARASARLLATPFLATSMFTLPAAGTASAGDEQQQQGPSHYSRVFPRKASTQEGEWGQIELYGKPEQPYFFWFSSVEEPYEIEKGILLDINPIRQLTNNLVIEGNFDGNGQAWLDFPIGPEWTGARINMQIVTLMTGGKFNYFTSDGTGFSVDVSPLARMTFQQPNTFADGVGSLEGTCYRSYIPLEGSNWYSLPYEAVPLVGGSTDGIKHFSTFAQDTRNIDYNFVDLPMSATGPVYDFMTITTGGTEGDPFYYASRSTHISIPYDDFSFDGPDMLQARAGHFILPLHANDNLTGEILVVGGISPASYDNTSDGVSNEYHYNSLSDTSEYFYWGEGYFKPGPRLPKPLAFAASMYIGGGWHLITGGLTTDGEGNFVVSDQAWVFSEFDFAFFGPIHMESARMLHEMIRVNDTIIVLGGVNHLGPDALAPADTMVDTFPPTNIVETTQITDLFNKGGAFEMYTEMSTARVFPAVARVMNNSILVAGGFEDPIRLWQVPLMEYYSKFEPLEGLTSTEIIYLHPLVDPFISTPEMHFPRVGATALPSPLDGRILIMGGGPSTVELYQPFNVFD